MKWYLKFSNWYFSKNTLPYWCVLIADLMIVFLSWIVVYFISHGVETLIRNFWPLVINSLHPPFVQRFLNFLGPGLTVNVEAKVKEQIILDSSE